MAGRHAMGAEEITPVEEPFAADLFAMAPPDAELSYAPWINAAPPSMEEPEAPERDPEPATPEPYPEIDVDPDIPSPDTQSPEPEALATSNTQPTQYAEPVLLYEPTGEGPAQWERGSGGEAALP